MPSSANHCRLGSTLAFALNDYLACGSLHYNLLNTILGISMSIPRNCLQGIGCCEIAEIVTEEVRL